MLRLEQIACRHFYRVKKSITSFICQLVISYLKCSIYVFSTNSLIVKLNSSLRSMLNLWNEGNGIADMVFELAFMI